MTLITPPSNDWNTLTEESPLPSGHTRRLLQTTGYIALMLLLLYLLYSSSQEQPVSKTRITKKPWSISQGFLLPFYLG
ncbi:hypothetical protein KBK19_00330 [Microvirga sp. STR05]|uniref:Uncharacterized protein n=1 Tax=Hymenobacter duratus TaxID=2771356 RepID=A0ABR8JFA6_9BACT|nr:hypothetical protein [Hymenobacter duratus]MBD2713474.1 hypothetical protein [Hymenobacter duratus]MBR7948376.1 hypothetical protein [Microvirga sp. STR05]